MALIAMAVYDTEENKRTWMTDETILSLRKTVDLEKHRLFIIDNASCQATKELLDSLQSIIPFTLITNETNIGTAKAINLAWKQRNPGEHVIKMDNDVVIHQSGWVDLMEEAISREPIIGIIGLKRKDLAENPNFPEGDWRKSYLSMLPQEPGEKCIVIEQVNHVMGTCQMYSSDLIDKIGGLYQMDGLYGFDDALSAVRCHVAGLINVFIPYIEIDHIDNAANEAYKIWKQDYAGIMMPEYTKTKEEYFSGNKDIYYPL